MPLLKGISKRDRVGQRLEPNLNVRRVNRRKHEARDLSKCHYDGIIGHASRISVAARLPVPALSSSRRSAAMQGVRRRGSSPQPRSEPGLPLYFADLRPR